jgi:putative PIN family toxin of toxin-antitoxin system
MQLNRVVFDTNVWITYFYNGEFEQLVEIVEEFEIPIFSSKRLRQELNSVIRRPKLIKKLNYPTDRYIGFYTRLSHEIEIDERFDRVKDIKDNYIIDIAYTADCSHVITGDPHLLSLKHVGSIQIISLADFKRALQKLKKT